jgi:hypothetical protein
MSEISTTISNFVDSAEKIYTLAMRIKDDLTKYSQVKKKPLYKGYSKFTKDQFI